ncbi:hypothetical protein HWV62_42058 [Athelia sp. TMB]|nr:hypothetical protein HWV62_42058 [Athelia sp. TMB]
MPNLRLAWAPLTIIVTVAIYLHLRGFPGAGTSSAPASPLADELVPAEKAVEESNGEVSTDDKTNAHSASSSAAGAPTAETVTSCSRTVAVQRVLQHPEPAAESPTVLHREDLVKANALRDQSTALLDLGQKQEALAAITEATALLRALAVEHPTAFNAGLASSLRVLSSRLVDVGRREEALLAIEEAVDLQRALANERPAEFNVEVASSLNHHSNRLWRLDRHEEALLAIQESVDMYRTLAEERPETHRAGLAASLFNMFNRLSKYDLREEALVVIQEASNIYQELATEEPSTYGKNLSLCLTKLSECLNGLGRKAEHVAVMGEASNVADPKHTLPTRGRHDDRVVDPNEPATHRRDPVVSDGPDEGIAHTGPIFNTIGTLGGIIHNVAGDYIAADEDPATKISQMLPYAKGASWDPQLTCLPGTRMAMLAELDAWAHCAVSEKICWVKDVAGSGKTALLHSVAEKLQRDGVLATAFFFSRDTATRNDPKTLFTTMAQDIASLNVLAAQEIAEALKAEPALASASLSRQFDALILGPSRRLPSDRPAVFVIDALDESISHDLDTELLVILRDKVTQLPPHVRILITSRPTSMIEEYLSGRSHVKMRSFEIFSDENKRDIDKYVDTQLRDQAILVKMGLASPDEIVIRDLKRLAEGLFIWIATVCNFLRTAYRPRYKLQALLSKSSQQGSPPEKKMDQLYAAILAECGDWDDADFVKDYDLIMGTIMALKRPISLAALRALHDGSQDLEAEQLLQRFGSVLIGFHDAHKPIRILHLSFHEFVTDRAAHDPSTKHFYLSEKGHSGRLAELCAKTLNHELAKPIAGTGYLLKHPDDAPGIPTIHGASEQLVYGCAHLTSHLQDVERPQTIQAHIITLLSRHLVTWIEVVAGTDIFRGSLQIEQWVQRCAPEVEHHFEYQHQANAVFALGNRLAYAVRMEESLLATQEAVVLFRALASDQPATINGNLARCLTNLAIRLSALGRAQEALVTVEEAVDLYRALVAEHPAAYTADLATSLNNLSHYLSDLGRPQEALSVVEEAVHLRRALAAERPAAHNADLAISLNNVSHHLSDLGRPQEALSAVEEVVNLRRALAAELPAVHNVKLALSLRDLSRRLIDLGRQEEALIIVPEAVDLYRTLAAERPARFTQGLMDSLVLLGKAMVDLGLHVPMDIIQEILVLKAALGIE